MEEFLVKYAWLLALLVGVVDMLLGMTTVVKPNSLFESILKGLKFLLDFFSKKKPAPAPAEKKPESK